MCGLYQTRMRTTEWCKFMVTGKNNAGGTGGVRLFCESEDVQLCVVTFPGDPFFALLNAVEEEAEIELDGWRDENRHSTIATDLYLSLRLLSPNL